MAYGIIDLSKNLMGFNPKSVELRNSEFWAIDEVSFELKKGDVLGLIGLNGSGKSTILRMLTGIFPPDKGEIIIKGRVGALIAIGAGFHPHMTGKENIYLNGTILGMTRREINSKYQAIVDFAEVGDFLEAPVATYSSGMRVRLGFSVAVHMDPDVMLIDEVLAVGDFSFRQKCAEKINEIRRKAAVIFVSHNMRDVLMLCSKTIVLNNGKIVFCGDSKGAVEFYLEMLNDAEAQKFHNGKSVKIYESKKIHKSSIYGEIFQNEDKIAEVKHRWVDKSGNPVKIVEHGATVILKFSFILLQPVENLIIGVPIFYRRDMITAINTDSQGIKVNVDKNGCVKGSLIIDGLVLNPGKYTNIFSIVDSKEFLYRDFIADLQVREFPVSFGVFTLQHRWCFEVC